MANKKAKYYIVFLSAGHGGSDPGACAYGMEEADINLVVMLACRDELKRHGVTVVCSRTKDENDPVAQEVKEAIASGAVLAASFHVNAGKGDGSESYCNMNNKDGVELCEFAEAELKKLGQNSRGVKDGTHLYFIRKTPMTAVLFEIGFIDHNKDNDFFDTKAEQKKIGEAYAKAILKHLGIKYKKKTEPFKPYKVKVTSNTLKVRSGAGTKYKKVLSVKKNEVYTIIATKMVGKSKWGKLKSSTKEEPRWMNLKYTKKV